MSRNRPMKLPAYLHEDVFSFYTERLKEGMPITKIAEEYNKKENSTYAESTLRNTYERLRDNEIATLRQKELERRERLNDRREERLLHQRGVLQRKEALLKSERKKIIETAVVKEVVKETLGEYDENINVKELTIEYRENKSDNIPVFVISDAHAGYGYEGLYDDDVFQYRMEKAFNHILRETLDNQYTQITIAELGDQIEGTGLRKSQLAYTTREMTKQASLYEDVFYYLLTALAENLPEVKIDVLFITKDNHSELRVHNTGPGNMNDHMAEVIGRGISNSLAEAHKGNRLTNVNISLKDAHFIDFGEGRTMYLAHGHQYSKDPNKLVQQVYADLNVEPSLIMIGHFHQFTVTTRHVRDGIMGSVITAPSLVGDTDFGKRLHLSSHPGALKVTITNTHIEAKFLELT